MAKRFKVNDVFVAQGQPKITYVERSDGGLERDLRDAILQAGQLCLLTGPSKIGKTTLYKRVLSQLKKQPLVVRCDDNVTPTELWKRALEELNFERISSTDSKKAIEASGTVGAKAEVGWAWLARLTGSVSISTSGKVEDGTIKEKILASPSPQHLVPALKYLPITLVVEDFHYLKPEVQRTIFQSWKTFVDNQVTVIVVGTTHHAVDVANSNKDLIGRIAHLEATTWRPKDLAQIIQKGFDHLAIKRQKSVLEVIPKESAGLPIIVQQVCAQLLFEKVGPEVLPENPTMRFSDSDVQEALNYVAIRRYGTMKTYYELLIHGPRKKARKYDTYALILACFTIGDLKFSLSRTEIDERLQRLPIPKEDRPPPASVNSTLGALEKFQKGRGIELLEWMPQTKTLYILEPAFLFYLRWRQIKEHPKQLDLFMTILDELNQHIVESEITSFVESAEGNWARLLNKLEKD